MAYQVDAAVIATQLHESLMQRRARQADLAPEFIPRWHDRIAGLSADGLRCALHGRAARHADARRTALKMDATHPQHNPVIGCGWIKRREDDPIKSNTGRRRRV